MAETRSRDPSASDRTAGGPEASAFAFDDGRRDDSASVGQLLRRLAEQGTKLAQQQTELVKAELSASVTDMKEAAGAMAGAAVLGLAGLGVTLMGVAYLLAGIMPLWLATVIVGVATLIGAYALFVGGQKKLKDKSMTAERSRHTLERAPDAISGHTNQERNHG